MAGTRYIDLITDAETITQVTSLRAVVKRLANDLLARICGLAEWPFLWTVDWFQTVAEYATGTLAVTTGSATITGSGTTFTAAMVGRNIRISGDTAYYTIKTFTSTTVLVLDQLYEGSTDTDATYSIYKDEYLLRADVDLEKRIRQAENGVALFSLSATEFDEAFPSPQGTGLPSLDVYTGRAVKTYSTGTVAMSSGTRLITGSSTAWTSAEGVTRGTKLKIGTLIFTVNTVDSDTQLTVYEIATAAIAAGTSYVAILGNAVVQLHAIPTDVRTFYYRFQRQPAVMDADNDLPDLPSPMHALITLGMLPWLWRQKGMIDRAQDAQSAFQQEFEQWRMKYAVPVLDRRMPIHPFSTSKRIREAQWPAGTGVVLFR